MLVVAKFRYMWLPEVVLFNRRFEIYFLWLCVLLHEYGWLLWAVQMYFFSYCNNYVWQHCALMINIGRIRTHSIFSGCVYFIMSMGDYFEQCKCNFFVITLFGNDCALMINVGRISTHDQWREDKLCTYDDQDCVILQNQCCIPNYCNLVQGI